MSKIKITSDEFLAKYELERKEVSSQIRDFFFYFKLAVNEGKITDITRRPILQSPEWCPECNKVFLATFEIRGCNDHKVSKPIMEPDDES